MKRKKLLSTTTLLMIAAMGLALFLALTSAGATTVITDAEINEFLIPTPVNGLGSITPGPDGNLWFTETYTNKVGKITALGSIIEYDVPTPDSSPCGITCGPDGNIWFAEAGGKIGRVTPSGSFAEYPIPPNGGEPSGITVGPDGNLWFTEWGSDMIGRITTSGSITEYPVPTKGTALGSITAGPDGNLWFTEFFADAIGKVTTSGIFSEYKLPTPLVSPMEVAAGPDGNVWVTALVANENGYICKVAPSGSFTLYTAPEIVAPDGITAGPDGNMWFADLAEDKIFSITPSGSFTAYEGLSGSEPTDIAAGPDGNVWFTERDSKDWNAHLIGQLVINKPVPPPSQWKSTFYFAEGYTGVNFQEYACLENPNSKAADTWITCMFSDGTSKSQLHSLPPTSRQTININQLAGAGREVSMRVVSTSPGIVAERPMYFNYLGQWSGGSDAVGATSPAKKWYFAEGNTLPSFDEYVTVQNPGGTTANLTFHYMVEGKGEVVVGGTVNPMSRATFKTRDQLGSGSNASLYLYSDQNIVAERPMYFNYQGLAFNNWTGGHDVLGANSPAKSWYFAEGTTRAGFEEWLCLQNPGSTSIKVRASYQLGPGQGSPIHKSYTVQAHQRLTVSVNKEIGANKDTSVYLSSASAFIAERPMYFNYQGAWDGGHDVLGANKPATAWLFAEGFTGSNFNEWLCLQNPGSADAHVTISYYTTSGQVIEKSWTVSANTRQTVNVNGDAGADLEISTKVTSDKPIIVERPMYFNYNGLWTGGHDMVGIVPGP